MSKREPKSGKDFVRIAEKSDKATVKRVSGSHHIVEFDDGTSIPVPVHGNRQLGKGLQRKILEAFKAAGVLVIMISMLWFLMLWLSFAISCPVIPSLC